MQGKKDYQEKLFAQFQLSERIPKNNFYRVLKEVLDLDFLYPLTKCYYGESGQKSIDPVVFFKLCLVGYLENIISDRHKYTSNKTHYSPTDPDARISVKPGKARKLNYMSQLSVDTGHHVITDIKAYHADGKDSLYLPDICNRLEKRLHKQGLLWHNCIADTGYSSGENYAFLEPTFIKILT